ncbi:MAG TPA: hypothetical protein VFX79_03065 [Candidatus Saccharimonadales bacterium]|nr:hypothetical protein [Candidatus Saccharimonadales bacterium]
MTQLESCNPEAPKNITQHPYVKQPIYNNVGWYLAHGGFEGMVDFEKKMLDGHLSEPMDAIIGEDVSGRIPALTTHHFLRLAQAGGHIPTVPKTFFMATDGIPQTHDYDTREEFEAALRNKLINHAAQITNTFDVQRAGIITEIIITGKSISRLEDALSSVGVSVDTYSVDDIFLNIGRNSGVLDPNDPNRIAVGVRKNALEAVSHKHPEINPKESAQLRRFIKDYSEAIYLTIFGELPPRKEDISVDRTQQPIKTSMIRKAFRSLAFR